MTSDGRAPRLAPADRTRILRSLVVTLVALVLTVLAAIPTDVPVSADDVAGAERTGTAAVVQVEGDRMDVLVTAPLVEEVPVENVELAGSATVPAPGTIVPVAVLNLPVREADDVTVVGQRAPVGWWHLVLVVLLVVAGVAAAGGVGRAFTVLRLRVRGTYDPEARQAALTRQQVQVDEMLIGSGGPVRAPWRWRRLGTALTAGVVTFATIGVIGSVVARGEDSKQPDTATEPSVGTVVDVRVVDPGTVRRAPILLLDIEHVVDGTSRLARDVRVVVLQDGDDGPTIGVGAPVGIAYDPVDPTIARVADSGLAQNTDAEAILPVLLVGGALVSAVMVAVEATRVAGVRRRLGLRVLSTESPAARVGGAVDS